MITIIPKVARITSIKSLALCTVMLLTSLTEAGDWPMWRCDAGRTAVSSDSLPTDKPNLLWEHTFTQRTQVWDSPLNNYLMQYDKSFEPIVSGQTMLVGFNDSDKMMAIDTRSGKIKWTFFADGPIRLAPVAHDNKVYFGSDDGHFYCVDIASGKEIWKFRAAPAAKKLVGNRRIISMWPVRGGAVIDDGSVYFSAGIWPFMGVFIYALDANTGEVQWLNDHDSIKYRSQPHKPSMAFAGVATQGAFIVNKDKLIVPGGRSIPAILDRNTGKIARYDFDKHSKNVGGDFAASTGNVYYTRGRQGKATLGATQFNITSGNRVLKGIVTGVPVLDQGVTYCSGDEVSAYKTDASGTILSTKPLWSVKADATGDLIKAGDRLYAAGKNSISAITVKNNSASIAWTLPLNGDVLRLIAADDRLFAVTVDGRIMAFGKGTKSFVSAVTPPLKTSAKSDNLANKLLAQTKSKSGWALANGLDTLSLVGSILGKTKHHFVILDTSAEKVFEARRILDAAGLYGSRVTVHVGTPATFDLAPYALELAITGLQSKLSKNDTTLLLSNLRPYGGKLFMLDKNSASFLPSAITQDGYTVSKSKTGVTVTRKGALIGAASWTHNYGSIAQTAKSDDTRVKLPLGVLWWGGSSNMDVLPRHAHGPTEQVIGGRLFIQGIDSFSARDVYTGRILWKRDLPGLNKIGVYFTNTYKPAPLITGYNQKHAPGSNLRGTNYVAADDKLYLIQDEKCLILDSATGETLNTLYLPGKVNWGYIGIQGDMLIGGAGFSQFSDLVSTAVPPLSSKVKKGKKGKKKKKKKENLAIYNKSASQKLVIMNRHDGKVIWSETSEHGYLHNGIAVSKDTIFAIDRVPLGILEQMARRGQKAPEAKIHAYDLSSGKEKWQRAKGVFGSYVSFSETHNILLHSTRPSRDMSSGETGKRMVALNSHDGSVIWEHNIRYATFPIIHTNDIISESGKWSLLTGEPISRINPITGGEEPWSWKRTYGCNYPVASENLLTFRSGAASFYDLQGDGGTGSFGGFKSGCSIDLIAADGVLSAPDYTRTCSCSYQNQTSLAMVHMPNMEFWTSSTLPKPKEKSINRIGLNFAAPGDRKSGDTFWVDYPSVGGQSPDPTVSVDGDITWNLDNASRFGDVDNNWIYASSAENIKSLSIQLGSGSARQPKSSSPQKDVSENSFNLIEKGAEWSYSTDQQKSQDWTLNTFNDSQWKSGPAGFGYSDGDDATELKDMKGNYSSVYIRKEFSVADPSTISTLQLMVGFDDYFTAYINGKKVAFVKKKSNERKKGKWQTFKVNNAVLVPGKNVIAIVGMNIKENSSDFSLDPYLVAETAGSKKKSVTRVVENDNNTSNTTPYTVRLFFAEHRDLAAGERVFDLSLNDKKVLQSFDIISQVGAARKGMVKEFKNIPCNGQLTVTMTASTKDYGPIISGIEIIKE